MVLSCAKAPWIAEDLRRCSGNLDAIEATGLLQPAAEGGSIHPSVPWLSRRGNACRPFCRSTPL